jgi:hypothetical protein
VDDQLWKTDVTPRQTAPDSLDHKQAMIPPFNDAGHLPPGTHTATLTEIEQRFGTMSELRRVQMESVRWLVDLAVRAGVQRIVLNGSFVTDIIEPNDVDCVLLVLPGKPKDLKAFRELRSGLPFVDAAIVRSNLRFDQYVRGIFAADRLGASKGVIEVIL